MGRAKLDIKFLENLRTRRTTYMARMKGLKKKAGELSLLCGVDVLLASVSPELNTVEFWPEKDTPDFRRICERYVCFRKRKNDSNCESNGFGENENSEQIIPPLFHQEMISMEIKLKEVRDRLFFLDSGSHSHNENPVRQPWETEERLPAQITISAPSQVQPIEQPSSFTQYLHSFDPHEQPYSYDQSLPPHQQPSSPFAHFLTSYLVDFNKLNPPLSFVPSDSASWSHLDDSDWCNSLLVDYESEQRI